MSNQRIHFGALDGAAIAHQQHNAVQSTPANGRSLDEIGNGSGGSGGILGGIALGAEQQAILDDFERKKRARSLAVPTEDRKVRARLRAYAQPITLFGEGPADRRDRLRVLMQQRFEAGASLEGDGYDSDIMDSDDDSDDSDEAREPEDEFFYPGGSDLFEARQFILDWSLPRAAKRIAAQRSEVQVNIMTRKKMKLDWFNHLKTFSFSASQLGDERPLSFCTFAPNSRLLATGSWSGLTKIWSIPNCEQVLVLKGQKERVSGLAFHPGSTLSQSAGALNLVTSGMDGTVNLHNFESNLPIGQLVGHEQRVARVAFHPSGRFVGTASFDHSWRLWDSETTQALLWQEGHSREVFAIGFQGDGALVATAGNDAIGRVWDLRSGRSIMVLQGHVKPVLALDWSPNGHILATGSEDNTIRIWDVRQAKCTYVVPAHTNLISSVKFWTAGDGFESEGAPESWSILDTPRFKAMEGMEDADDNGMRDDEDDNEDRRGDASLRKQLLSGGHLVSSSYDGTCKIFSEGDWKPLKSLPGLEGKVMCCDVSSDGKYIVTASYDRTFKLFSSE